MENDKAMQGDETKAAYRSYKRKARNILIHKPMQREFTFVVIALLMISSLAIGLVIHHTIHDAMVGGGFRFGKISPYEVLSDVSYQLIFRVSCILFATLLVLGLFGAMFLHRVAGPVYRFRQIFLRLNKGDIPPPFKLREGDFFIETADEINKLLRKLESQKKNKEKAVQEMDSALATHPPDAAAKHIKGAKDLLQGGD